MEKLRCLRCDQPATYTIRTVTDPDMRLRKIGRSTYAPDYSESLTTVACDDHHEEIMDEYVGCYGFTSSMPRESMPWRYWVASWWWRPFNAVQRKIR